MILINVRVDYYLHFIYPRWAESKEYCRLLNICFLHWPAPWNPVFFYVCLFICLIVCIDCLLCFFVVVCFVLFFVCLFLFVIFIGLSSFCVLCLVLTMSLDSSLLNALRFSLTFTYRYKKYNWNEDKYTVMVSNLTNQHIYTVPLVQLKLW